MRLIFTRIPRKNVKFLNGAISEKRARDLVECLLTEAVIKPFVTFLDEDRIKPISAGHALISN